MSAPKIPDGIAGRRVREAFARLGYDPSNPNHWFALLDSYIEGSRRPPGRPRAWTAAQLNQLLVNVAYARAEEEHRLRKAGLEMRRSSSLESIFKKLAKLKEYRDLSWKTLRNNYHRAWMPEHNSILARALDTLAEDYVTEEDGSNSRERLLIWMKTGITDVYQDEAGNVHVIPRGLRLVRK
jgi:lambda repressor-like predicted transcriptional regulator